MISKSGEEYLKTMYLLQIKKREIRVTDIALAMNCSKAGVNKAINNLKENGLVNYETYGKIELTKSGENLAKKILEAYDIVFLFLKDVLEIDEDLAKEDAEKIKSQISDNTVHKTLNLNNLDCDYDVAKERCRECKRRKIK